MLFPEAWKGQVHWEFEFDVGVGQGGWMLFSTEL